MTTVTEIQHEVNRRRKSHKKSRLGCRNCKLRRVKCDETKPECTKCQSFGVTCNYNQNSAPLFDPTATDLQLSVVKTDSIVSPLESINRSIRGIIQNPPFLFPTTISDDTSTFELDGSSLARLGRFQARTVLSVGTEKAASIYQTEIIKLAYTHPYLMHVVQTLTAVHDRYLSHDPTIQTTTEVYHWSRAAKLFNQKLSSKLNSTDRDALWATGALIGVIAFAMIDATTPEEAWPLKDPSPSDLDWLRMCEGKLIIRDLADPSGREDSVFKIIASAWRNDNPYVITPTRGNEGIPAEFCEVYNMNSSSTSENNPYYDALHSLIPLLNMNCDRSTTPYWFAFIHLMGSRCRDLLEQRDPRAVALFAPWYAKMAGSQWWVKRRAMLEGQAIVLWIERAHWRDRKLVEFVGRCREGLGMERQPAWLGIAGYEAEPSRRVIPTA